jgi:hypothetical protein
MCVFERTPTGHTRRRWESSSEFGGQRVDACLGEQCDQGGQAQETQYIATRALFTVRDG